MMQALVFRYSMPRFAFARLMGALTPRAYLSSWGPTGLQEIPEPRLLGDDWTVVRTAQCGVCGSDVKQIFLNASFDNPLTALIGTLQMQMEQWERDLGIKFYNASGWAGVDNVRLLLQPAAEIIPEPSSFLLAAVGLVCLGWYGRRRRRQVP